MPDFLNQILNFIAENPSIAGMVCFAAAMGEALFIIGLVVPSTVVLVGAGTLIGLGKLDPVSIFIWTTLGATAGDAISYWFGYFYKDKIKSVWPLSRYSHLVVRGEEYFKKHGGKSVFIGRFVPGVKSVVPGIAGMVGMDAWRFTVVNFTSAIAWTAAHIGPGIIAGSALDALGQISTRLALVVGALCVIVFLAVMLGRWLILIIMPLFPGVHSALHGWFARRNNRVSQWIAETFDPAHPRSAGMIASAIVLLISLPTFFWFIGEISPGEPMVRADVAILNLFESLRTPAGDTFMIAVTTLGDGVVVTAITLVVALYLLSRKAWRRATGFLVAMAATAVFVPVIKLMLHRSRPIELYSGADAFSFPSGHATLNAVLFGICAVLIAHDRSRWTKAGVFTVTAIYVITMGFSRIYLGAHWMSDVLGGLLFGIAMVSAFGFVFGPIRNEKVGRVTLAALVIGTLAVVGTWHAVRSHDSAIEAYAPRVNTEILAAADWLESRWQTLPERRIELNGDDEEPLVIQFAGSLDRFAEITSAQGWQRPPQWSLSSASGFVEGQTSPDSLPILPRSQNGRQPDLVLIQKDPDDVKAGRWVMRLWPSEYRILNGGALETLYLGSVVHEDILRPMGEFSGPRTDRDFPTAEGNPALLIPGSLLRKRANGAEVVLAILPTPHLSSSSPATQPATEPGQ